MPLAQLIKEKMEGKKEVALKMLKKGSSPDFIADVTGLDEDEIEALKQKL